jgi:hypothetical protein
MLQHEVSSFQISELTRILGLLFSRVQHIMLEPKPSLSKQDHSYSLERLLRLLQERLSSLQIHVFSRILLLRDR